MILIANATTHCYISTVSQSNNVGNPSSIQGTRDGSYATFYSGSQLVAQLTATPPSGANGWLYANSQLVSTVNVYSAPTATSTSWNYVGTATITTYANEYTTSGGSFPGTHQYIGLYNSNPYRCYIDAGGAVY